MRRRYGFGIAVVVAAGIVLRVWVYKTPAGAPDSDEAIVGLMTRHAVHGEFTTFYWGQPYGGSQEALLGVPLFAMFGSSLVALRLVPICLTAIAAVLVWRAGRRMFGDPGGAVAALLLWLWPAYAIVHTTPAFGFYGATLVYVSLLLLLALRFVDAPTAWRAACFGLALGLGFWESAQIIPVALPVIAWTIWHGRPGLRAAAAAAAGAVVGALPWLVWNIRNDWHSVLARANLTQYVHGLRLFFSPLLPMLLGLRTPLTGELLLPKPVMYAIYVALLLAVVWGAVRFARTDASLVYAAAIAFPFIWAISHRVSLLTSHPVYLVVASPLIVLVVGSFVRTALVGAVVLALAVCVSAVTIHRMNAWLGASRPHWPPNTPRRLSSLVATLDRLRLDHVYAEYWIAYRLDFDSNERLVATPDDWLHWTVHNGVVSPVPSVTVRYRRYQAEVLHHRHGFVFFRRPIEPTPIVAALRGHGYSRTLAGPFVVWAPPRGS